MPKYKKHFMDDPKLLARRLKQTRERRIEVANDLARIDRLIGKMGNRLDQLNNPEQTNE